MTMRPRKMLLAMLAVPMVVGVAACGSSDAPQATSAAGGGSPSSATAADGRLTAAARKVITNYPSTPVCNPGGLPDEDEETCQHFWNHMLQWTAITDATRGPVLDGAGAGSMIYEDYEALFNDRHWWGPNNLKKKDAATGKVSQCDSSKEKESCYGAYLEFGAATNIETYDTGNEVKSRVTWKLTAGDVAFGREYFTASNDGGKDGIQWAFCGPRSEKGGSGEWVSCSRANAEGDGATINTDQPAGNDEDYASFGWVIEDYPVLVGIANQLADSRLDIEQPPTPGRGVALSRTGSSTGMVDGGAKLAGSASAVDQPLLWLAGFRSRTGEGAISIEGRLAPATDTAKDNAWSGAEVTVTVKFTKDVKTCEVKNTDKGGDQAKCEIRQFTPGGRSTPGVLLVYIQRGSGSTN